MCGMAVVAVVMAMASPQEPVAIAIGARQAELIEVERVEPPESALATMPREGWVVAPGVLLAAGRAEEAMSADTPSQPALIEYSDAYFTRLTIHKWASWAMLPMFAAQYVAGEELIEGDAPGWARPVHDGGIVGVAALFGVNTVTGVWNWWDAREDPSARGWRTAHSLLMLAADAGFVATAALAEGDKDTHRAAAFSSMGVAMMSWVMMLPPLRRE